MRRFLALLVMTGMVLPALGGCASRYGEQRTTVNYYPACYAPIQDLRERENEVGKTTAGSAVIGALGGALIGLLATGKAEGALVGAAAGGATGAVAGNIYARNKQRADDNARLASYLQELDGDISQLDVESAAARRSIQCYDQQFHILVAAIKAGKISRQAAAQRYGEISAGYEEASNILGTAGNKGMNMAQQYEQAFMNEERDMQAPQRQASAPRNTAQNKQAIRTARKRNQELAQKSQAVKQEAAEARQVSANRSREIAQLTERMRSAEI